MFAMTIYLCICECVCVCVCVRVCVRACVRRTLAVLFVALLAGKYQFRCLEQWRSNIVV